MKTSEELEFRVTQLEEENKFLKSKLSEFNKIKAEYVELKEELKEANQQIKFLEEAFEKLRRELRKYHNENTPSGAIPPYLKPTLEIKRELSENKEESENNERKFNIRNSRPKRIDRTETLELEKCPKCGRKLKKMDTKPIIRIIFKLEMPTVERVEYVRPRYYCDNCDEEFLPSVPNALPGSKFDLTTSIFISVLFIGMNISQGKIAELLSFFGLDISKATVCNILRRLKEYLGDEYAELEIKVLEAKAKCKDETSHKHNGRMNWVWVAATAKEVCYWIENKRNYETARRLFKDDKGISTVDGYKAYDVPGKPIQRDWAHMFRIAKNPEHWFTSKREIDEYKKLVKELGELYHNAKKERIEKGESKKLKEEYEKKLFDILASIKHPGKNANKLINYIMHYNLDWFTFLEHEEVEPTSNRAERALRPLVIKRKISQQTRGDESKESYAMQMSLYMTSKLRDENYMDFLKNVVEDKLHVAGKF